MYIFIDESGAFVSAPTDGKWNVVVALIVPESDRRKVEESLRRLKVSSSIRLDEELKINSVPEEKYGYFLDSLAKLRSTLFATATDSGLNSIEQIRSHQSQQAANVLVNLPHMRHESGKEMLLRLARRIETLSPQQYAQLVCHVDLLHDVMNRGINYYVQRLPATLGAFRWRVDQKNARKPEYETLLEQVAPALLQSRSMREPSYRIVGYDYRKMKPYLFAEDEVPEYLENDYGIRIQEGINAGRLLREDLKFEDSVESRGIQVADLLASGLRKCLRGGFQDNSAICGKLGRLMVQNERGKYPISLVSLGTSRVGVDFKAESAMHTFKRVARAFLARDS